MHLKSYKNIIEQILFYYYIKRMFLLVKLNVFLYKHIIIVPDNEIVCGIRPLGETTASVPWHSV